MNRTESASAVCLAAEKCASLKPQESNFNLDHRKLLWAFSELGKDGRERALGGGGWKDRRAANEHRELDSFSFLEDEMVQHGDGLKSSLYARIASHLPEGEFSAFSTNWLDSPLQMCL